MNPVEHENYPGIGLRPLLNRLSPRSRVRQAGEQLLETGEVSDWNAIHGALASPSILRYREMHTAIWVTSYGAKAENEIRYATDMLTGILHETSLPFPRRAQRTINLTFFGIIAVLVLNAVVQGYYDPVGLLLGSGLFWICVTYASFFVRGVLLDKLGEQAAHGLAILKDPASLNSLAEAQSSLNDKRPEAIRWTQRQDPAVARAIPHVASALTLEHYGTLTKRTISELCGFLNSAPEQDALMLLHGLKAAGTGDALEHVAQLAKSGRTSMIRSAAEDALLVLMARNRLEQAPSRLLRASNAPDNAEQVLLRPLPGEQTYEPDVLLRPVDAS